MPKHRVALSLDADLLARADAKRAELGQSRTTFVERALESALDFEDRLPRPPKRDGYELAALGTPPRPDLEGADHGTSHGPAPGNPAAEKAKREAPPDRNVKSSDEAKANVRGVPKAGKR